MHLYEFTNLESYLRHYLNPYEMEISPLVQETWAKVSQNPRLSKIPKIQDLNDLVCGTSRKPLEAFQWLWLIQDLLVIADRHFDLPLDLSDFNRLFEPYATFQQRLYCLNPLIFLMQSEKENEDWRLHLKPFGKCSAEVAAKIKIAYPSISRELNLQG